MVKRILMLLVFAALFTVCAKPLTLVKNGKAVSTIVVADNASEVAKYAAEMLAEHHPSPFAFHLS